MNNRKSNNIVEKLFLGLFAMFTLIIIATTILSSIFLRRFTGIIQSNIEQRMIKTAELAAHTIASGDELNQYWSMADIEGENVADAAAEYETLRGRMQDFAEKNGLVYVYYMRDIGDNQEQIIIDSDPIAPLTLDYTESMDEYTSYVFTTQIATCMKLGDYNDAYEGIIAAYAPVYDSKGNFVAIVGVDIFDVDVLTTGKITSLLTYVFMSCALFLASSAVALLILFRRKALAYQEASIAKSEFLSRMSHEIRTPMNAIIGFSRMANEATELDEIKPYLKHISESSSYLLQLINSILDISKIEAGKMQLNKTIVSPEDIMKNIDNMMRNQAQAKNLDIKIIMAGNIPNYIYCDSVYLTQIIINLLSNALKFTPEKGKIIASMKQIEQIDNRCCLQFEVIDTGIGIKKEHLVRIFEAFEQAEGGITRKFGGTGLGLNISKLLVNLMGGDLKVESEVGKGSKFWFSLWFDIVKKEDEPVKTVAVSTEKETIDLNGKIILIVEDNEINQIIAGNTVEGFGAKAEFADNGKIGLDMFIENPDKYYFILMDLQMPEMDGFEATRQIRASKCHNAKSIPIIAMSANVFKEDIDASLEVGMNAHIGKPFEPTQLITLINNLIKKPHQ